MKQTLLVVKTVSVPDPTKHTGKYTKVYHQTIVVVKDYRKQSDVVEILRAQIEATTQSYNSELLIKTDIVLVKKINYDLFLLSTDIKRGESCFTIVEKRQQNSIKQ